jgi:hypothetical protein
VSANFLKACRMRKQAALDCWDCATRGHSVQQWRGKGNDLHPSMITSVLSYIAYVYVCERGALTGLPVLEPAARVALIPKWRFVSENFDLFGTERATCASSARTHTQTPTHTQPLSFSLSFLFSLSLCLSI